MIERFVCAGSLNVDLSFPVERLPEEHEKLRCRESYLACGGAAANTAHWLARLGQPGELERAPRLKRPGELKRAPRLKRPVTMLGCVGDDPLGDLAVTALAEVGVDTRRIQRTRQSLTGMAAIFVNPRSKRMVTSGGANACFDPSVIEAELFAPGVHLHVATALNRIALPLMRLAKARGATVSCDLDEAPDAEMMPCLDWVFLNHSTLRRWTGADDPREARERLAPGTWLIVTQGEKGALALGPGEEVFHPAFPAEVVDRTGGGDAFAAGFLHGLALDRPLRDCLRLGLLLAARVIAEPGSRPASVDLNALGANRLASPHLRGQDGQEGCENAGSASG
jgi:ribokinase